MIVNPGTADKVAADAIALGAEGFKKEFIPESKDILYHSKMLDGGERETMQFTAPTKPGNYPFLCTFPGHDKIMRGIFEVK